MSHRRPFPGEAVPTNRNGYPLLPTTSTRTADWHREPQLNGIPSVPEDPSVDILQAIRITDAVGFDEALDLPTAEKGMFAAFAAFARHPALLTALYLLDQQSTVVMDDFSARRSFSVQTPTRLSGPYDELQMSVIESLRIFADQQLINYAKLTDTYVHIEDHVAPPAQPATQAPPAPAPHVAGPCCVQNERRSA